MKIPNNVKFLINEIEEEGKRFSSLEKDLYDWLESVGINPEQDTPNKNGECIDMALEFLLHNNDGSDLIKFLQNYGGKTNE